MALEPRVQIRSRLLNFHLVKSLSKIRCAPAVTKERRYWFEPGCLKRFWVILTVMRSNSL